MVEFSRLGRCQSGRLGPPAKRLLGHKISAAGSNPVLPANQLRKSGFVCCVQTKPLF